MPSPRHLAALLAVVLVACKRDTDGDTSDSGDSGDTSDTSDTDDTAQIDIVGGAQTLGCGQTSTLVVNADGAVVFTTTDPDVVTVDTSGTLTPGFTVTLVSAGTAMVTIANASVPAHVVAGSGVTITPTP